LQLFLGGRSLPSLGSWRVQLTKLNSEKIDIEELLNAGIDNLLKLDYAYEIADMDKKREIIAAVCPESSK
jgi:hypothetical protein